MKISFITTCKGRRKHLEETLPLWLSEKPDEVIVVDVNCPDGTSAWLTEKGYPVKIVKLPIDGFHVTKARNLGAQAASNPLLCFVDADIIIQSGFVNWMKKNVTGNYFALRARKNEYDGVHEQGTVVCKASDFNLVGGYDELFSTYGGEDRNLYEKFKHSGMRPIYYPQSLMESIPHDDQLRMQFHNIKAKDLHSAKGRIYAAAKRQVLPLFPGKVELPLELRQKIMKEIDLALARCGKGLEDMEPIRLSLNVPTWLPPPYVLSQKLMIELNVNKKEQA